MHYDNINVQNKENNLNKDEQNKKVYELNKQNVEDLDALYFYDKVKMKDNNKKKVNNNININKKKAISIPKILIVPPEEQNEEEEE